MEVKIRPALPSDMSAVLGLIKELADFEKAPAEVIVTEEVLKQDGFGSNPCFKAHVAEVNGMVVGMAFFFIGYSTWKGKLIFLDDLVVKKSFRENGIGTLLLDSVIDFANDNNVQVIKWQVLQWNEPAIEFYKKYNVHFDNDWIDCKMFRKEIKSAIENRKMAL